MSVRTVSATRYVTPLREGGSLHVPKAAKYQLANLGNVPLEVIEVRTGIYSGNDDMLQPIDAGDWSRNKPVRVVAAVVRDQRVNRLTRQ